MKQKVLLGNIDYEQHMTDEGNQFQRGLEAAGWHLSGKGFDNLQNCQEIIDTHQPTSIIVHDKRDWDPKNYWAFRRDIGFGDLEAVRYTPFRFGVVKDAGSMQEYHRHFCMDQINCNGVVTYYHDFSVLPHNSWMTDLPRFRTYHSISLGDVMSVNFTSKRLRGLVSGAANRTVYPLRAMAIDYNAFLDIAVVNHPNYHNQGSHTPRYLQLLSQFKVHIATASTYGFALRKIIESVAMCCTPVTNLPSYDVLPEIDGALVRVPDNIQPWELKKVIDKAEAEWDPEERQMWATKCRDFYNYHNLGRRLDMLIAHHIGQSHGDN